jgi:hypothetical protein
MGNDVPPAARLVVLSDVDVSIQDDGEPRTDVADLNQPARYERVLPKRRIRSISADARIGNIW